MSKSSSYHHGDLRTSLLDAAEEELVEKGAEAFSLRGTAKRAGVSHAAPSHHFKDTAGLLVALAARGFARLTERMRAEQADASADRRAQFIAAGVGYIRFAMENPQLLNLMFGQARSHSDEPELLHNADAAFSVLVNSVGQVRGKEAFRTDSGWRDVAAAWSMVHGYAQLAIAGKMQFVTGLNFDEQQPVIEDLVGRALP